VPGFGKTRRERSRGRALRSGRRRGPADGAPAIPREAWLRLAACTGAAALLQIDGTLITVALPAVGRSLEVAAGPLAAVLTAYFAAYALALFPGGRLVDRLGSRRLALTGLGLFGLGAAAGALAPTFEVLLLSRVAQGAGAGLVSPAALAGAVSAFPPERRGVALGLWGAGSGIANLLGPLLGGVLTVLLGWRADWWALVPMSLLAGAAVWAVLPPGVRVDESPELGGLRQRPVAAAALVSMLTFTVLIGTFFLAQQYLQEAGGLSALGAGATLIFVAVLVAVAAPLAGRLTDARGERLPAVLGFAAAGLALGVLGLGEVPLSGAGALPFLGVVGIGLGLLFAPTSRAALNAVSQSRHGRVSSVLSFGRLVGAGIGAALGGAALASGVTLGNVRTALVGGAALCLLMGLPAALGLSPSSRERRGRRATAHAG
jgi:predicted MFS family arabinose efflux permease